MANLSKSKTLFFPTSPRSPHKIINEIRLLVDNFSGKPWSKENQKRFASLLSKADFFEGNMKENDDFGARDRINRAPKALGFIDLDKISLTPAGKKLLSDKRVNEIFIRQFMKFQLPSPYHIDKEGRYNVKPYLEVLRLIYELDGLSKNEIAMFGMQLINLKLYENIKNQIKDFRKEKDSKKYTKKREFIFESYKKVIHKIYAEEISEEDFDLRQSSDNDLDKFISTKKANLVDYADAAIRYLRATGLVSFNIQSLKVEVKEDKIEDIVFLLNSVERKPVILSKEKYKEYLFDDSNISLFVDNRIKIIQRISELGAFLIMKEAIRKLPDLSKMNLEQLKDILEEFEFKKTNLIISHQKAELQTYSEYDDIIRVYDTISGGEIADPSLILEWNTWRAMAMLNDGNIQGNFKIDTDGSPLFTAPAKVPDIECDYRDFSITVEVTLSRGNKQYDMEGEPVARHLADIKRKLKKDSYCLFVAPTISEATLAHFYVLHSKKIAYYGGNAKIIPMDLDIFIKILAHAKSKKQISSVNLKTYLEFLSKKALETQDEQEWNKLIKDTADKWTVIPNQ